MRAKDLIQIIQETCLDIENDEIYISNDFKTDRGLVIARKDPDIAITPLDSTDQDENGGWTDADGEPIKGKPYHIW